MGGETEANVSGWTVDTLRTFLLSLRDDDLRALEIALTAHDREARGRSEQLRNEITALGGLADAKFVMYQAVVESQAEKVKIALDAAEKAIEKAERATERRFDSMNEFREQLRDQAGTFMPRLEALSAVANLEQRIADQLDIVDRLEKRVDLREGRSSGLQSGWGYLVAAISLIVVVVNVGVYLLGQ